MVQNPLAQAIVNRCGDCKLEIGNSTFNLLTGNFHANDISFSAQVDPTFAIKFTLDTILIRFDPLSVFRKNFSLPKVMISKAAVVLNEDISERKKEGKKTPQRATLGSSLEKLPQIWIGKVEIKDSSLEYRAKKGSRKGEFRLQQIHLITSDLATRPELVQQFSFRSRGLLENFGHFQLSTRLKPFEKKFSCRIDLNVEKMELPRLDSILLPAANLMVKGDLEKLATTLDASGSVLTAELSGTWAGLRIKFVSGEKGNPLSTLIKNIGSELEISDSAGEFNQSGKPPAHALVVVTRKPEESVIRWLLSGLTKGIEKLVKSD